MRFKFRRPTLLLIAFLTALTCAIATPHLHLAPSVARQVSALDRSNQSTDKLSQAFAAEDCRREYPENSFLEAFDQSFATCQKQQLETTLQTLKTTLSTEQDFSVQQDLQVLIQTAQQALRKAALEQKYRASYLDLSQGLAHHFQAQLSGSAANPKQALVDLKRFAGVEPNTTPLSEIARQRILLQLTRSELYLPRKVETELTPQQTQANLQTIRKSFEQSKLQGYQDALAQLETQLTQYTRFVQQEVLPKAKIGYRLPLELYTFLLEEQGVQLPVEDLIQEARTAFQNVQQDMNAIAQQIAQARGWQQTDYRDMIRRLKQDQLPANDILKRYQQRQKDIEAIIRKHKLVTLPKRGITIRLATAQENASFPVPRYFSPSSSRKNAEGVFTIPVLSDRKDYDDFTYPAVTWTLTAHEGRPGHDLQFTTIQEKEIPTARSFSFNAASHEGWALYAEAITKPYMPLEGQLICLQFQLLRSARAFLEPELQLGRISISEAMRVLTQDAGYSTFFADQEIQRYTTRMSGQAPAYFYGYRQLIQLRREVEAKLGNRFNPQQFHDLILSQGFLPPDLLKAAVLKNASS